MLRGDRLVGVDMPVTPGQAVVGQVVKAAQRGDSKLREGDHVAAVCLYGGAAEYVLAEDSMCMPLPRRFQEGEHMLQAPVIVWNMARVCVLWECCQAEHKRRDEREREHVRRRNEEMGFKGEGCLAVYGEGGYARLALEALKAMGVRERLVLVATSDKWAADKYSIKHEDVLFLGRCDVREELRKRGGAEAVVCVDMPKEHLEPVMDGMRFASSMVVLNPRQSDQLQVPLANVIAKCISMRGSPPMCRRDMEKAFELAERNNLHAPVKRYRFEQNDLQQAWHSMEQREQFEAPVIEVHQGRQ
ncbi:hypothetical protein JCM10908_002019 [Rhodotorula pacifica]|uniref:uncharacterized protein n=1 Tax=Rhodotorula pacifica TaxID=1495444 RepID=UPI00316E79DA